MCLLESAQISFTSNLTMQLHKSGVFVMVIGDKRPPLVGVLTFISMMNFMLTYVVHEKSLYNL